MRFQGVRVDLEKAHIVKKDLVKEEKQFLQKIKKRNRNGRRDMGSYIDS